MQRGTVTLALGLPHDRILLLRAEFKMVSQRGMGSLDQGWLFRVFWCSSAMQHYETKLPIP
jgi:hypothetical protein